MNRKKYFVKLMILEIQQRQKLQSNLIISKAGISKEEYISIIKQLKKHILRGDCYEINFCQEFFAEHADIDPLRIYQELSDVSPNPFSALYR